MINKQKEIKEKIAALIEQAYLKAAEEGALPSCEYGAIEIEPSKDKSHGDFATNFALKTSKLLKKNPREAAEILISRIPENKYIEKCEMAGPGFINFFLKNDWLYESVEYILENADTYGKVNDGNGKKVMVEFISANPTGPMHIGNARGGALGDSLAEVLSWAGYDVIREFYVNDFGNQIEKFALSLNIRFLQEIHGEDYIEMPEDSYHGVDIIDHVKAYISEFGSEELAALPEEERKAKLTDYALKKNIESLKRDTGRYGITYDNWFFESTLHESGKVKEVIRVLTENGYTYEKEDALWFKATEFGAEKDVVLIRANSFPTYFASDIAYHKDKLDRGCEMLINIWGADHHGHVARMEGALSAIGKDPKKLTVILMQLVRLIKDGEPYKVSKRSGKAVTLTDLIDEIGKDAARFFFNIRQSNVHFDFDLDLAISNSNENPVFYVQYAHARICSILRILEEEGIDTSVNDYSLLSALTNEAEIRLIEKITELPGEVSEAAAALDPSKITKYVIALASELHSFYNSNRVKSEDKTLMAARIMLIKAVKITIANSLKILGVSAPEKM